MEVAAQDLAGELGFVVVGVVVVETDLDGLGFDLEAPDHGGLLNVVGVMV